jgi:NTP pyrophosphatase (non-canonical NTP hydrolase)
MSTGSLFIKIIQWANDRNIVKGGTAKDQCLKLMQEVGELSDNLCKGNSPVDDIGDCMVVLAIIAEQHGLSVNDCLQCAYDDIKDRKGQLIDGVFVKEGG